MTLFFSLLDSLSFAVIATSFPTLIAFISFFS